MTTEHPLITPADAAAMLGVSRRSMARWIKLGRLETVTLPSGRARVRRADVERILTGAEPEPVESSA